MFVESNVYKKAAICMGLSWRSSFSSSGRNFFCLTGLTDGSCQDLAILGSSSLQSDGEDRFSRQHSRQTAPPPQ
jgi:hypothetical protein